MIEVVFFLFSSMPIRASVDALCRDEQGQILCDPRTKRLLTRREIVVRSISYYNISALLYTIRHYKSANPLVHVCLKFIPSGG